MDNSVFQGEMDPEIAALLGTDSRPKIGEPSPDYASLFNDDNLEELPVEAENLNINSGGFPEITKRLEVVPHKAFQDPDYYKAALSGEGNIAQRLHGILQKYLNCKDPKDRSVFRQQFIVAYWEFLANIARKSPGKLPDPKKYLLRFGILHPTLLVEEIRGFFSQIIVDNTIGQPIYYLDEWFKAVGSGLVRNSTTDEVRVVKTNNNIKLLQLLEKAQGKLDGTRVLLKAKDEERLGLERTLIERVSQISDHFPVDGLPEINSCYGETQKRIFAEVQEYLKALLKADHELGLFLRDYSAAEEDVKTLISRGKIVYACVGRKKASKNIYFSGHYGRLS
jgi:hypothetical protein